MDKFLQAAQFSTFRSVSNPHACRLENRFILGTSGTPIEDIQRYSNLTDSLEILEKTVEWGHIAPTAPDTLRKFVISVPYFFKAEDLSHQIK